MDQILNQPNNAPPQRVNSMQFGDYQAMNEAQQTGSFRQQNSNTVWYNSWMVIFLIVCLNIANDHKWEASEGFSWFQDPNIREFIRYAVYVKLWLIFLFLTAIILVSLKVFKASVGHIFLFLVWICLLGKYSCFLILP